MSSSMKPRRLMHTEQAAVAKEEEEWGEDWDCEFGRCELVHIGWTNNKALRYRTGNYIQYPVINHNGKEDEK